MNPLQSTKANPSFLSFNQIKPYCTRLHNIVLNNGVNSQKERLRLEQQLWAEVKLLRNFRDQSLLNYLIGFYNSILCHAAGDLPSDNLFHYHVLIRLGDLHRYKQCDKLAEYYYSDARNLFPLYGHAYNQLALILAKPEISPQNYYKCCYYYARAAKSSEKSLASIAESNLRMAASVYDGDILFKLLNGDAGIISNGYEGNADDSGGSEPRKVRKFFNGVPKTATDWFYVLVVAIYADNIQPASKLFIDFMRENFALQRSTSVTSENVQKTSIYCDRENYLILASLDILLDWMKLGSQGSTLLASIGDELRKFRNRLQSTLASLRYELGSMSRDETKDRTASPCILSTSVAADHSLDFNNLTDSPRESVSSDSRKGDVGTSLSPSSGPRSLNQRALPHDYTLRGFKPLDPVHSLVTFQDHKKLVSMIYEKALGQMEDILDKRDGSNNENFIDLDQLKQILHRITGKMEAFGGRLKRISRNIALESILASMSNP